LAQKKKYTEHTCVKLWLVTKDPEVGPAKADGLILERYTEVSSQSLELPY
jgi:hypothetical protein